MRGLLNNNGTITWDAEQTVLAGVASSYAWLVSIALDSNGYPWISYSYGEPVDVHKFYVTKSSTNDGTWSTEAGFPYEFVSTTLFPVGLVVPLTSGKMYAMYVLPGSVNPAYGRLYNGGWSAQETCTDTTAYSGAPPRALLSIGDDVHLIYSAIPGGLGRHAIRNFGTGLWSASVVCANYNIDNQSCVRPVLIENNNNIWAFWRGVTTLYHVFYSVYNGDTWSAPVDFVDESADQWPDNNAFTVSYNAYDDMICMMYLTKASTPYNIVFRNIRPIKYLAGRTRRMW